MKKIFYSLMVLTMTALTFTSCEDVPEPYALPTESGTKEEEPAADPTGDGTLDNPFNSVAANEYAQPFVDSNSPKEVYIKGIVVSVSEQFSAQYGNATFYISDNGKEAGQFYVFRALYLGNEKWVEGNETLKPGDEVIVCGKVTNYKGNTPETVQGTAYIYSLNGKTSGGSTPSTGGGTPSGDGTEASPYNAAAANKYVSGLAADTESDKDIYIKGKIAKIANNGEFNAQYGNASFYISDDGKDENTFYVFRTLYLGNKKWTEGDKQIKVGDEVVICGRVVLYMGNTPETAANKSYIFKLEGGSGSDTPNPGGSDPAPKAGTGDGSLSNPFNSVAANSVASQLADGQNTTKSYYIKGKICSIANNGEFGAQYGNASFYITDNGSDSDDKFYIFRTLYLGNRKWADGDTQIKVGDDVVVCAKLTNYRGNTPETVQGETYLYSLNGKTDGSSEGPGEVSGKGSYSEPYDVASAIAKASATGVYVKGFIVGYVEGQAYEEGAHFDATGDNVSATNVLLAPSASEKDPAKCMPVQLPKGAIRDGLNLKDNAGNLGKEVLLYGDIATYFNVPGIKNTSYAELGGKSIGTKAAAKRRVRR